MDRTSLGMQQEMTTAISIILLDRDRTVHSAPHDRVRAKAQLEVSYSSNNEKGR